MPRRLFTLLSALSLLMCIATLGLWIVTLNPSRQLYILRAQGGHRYWRLQSSFGRLSVKTINEWPANAVTQGTWFVEPPSAPEFVFINPDPDIDKIILFWIHAEYGAGRTPVQMTANDVRSYKPDEYEEGPYIYQFDRTYVPGMPGIYLSNRRSFWSIDLPHWFLATIFALLSLARLGLHRRLIIRHRLRRGLCPTCSYDLRASKDKCPECGSPIPPLSFPRNNKV